MTATRPTLETPGLASFAAWILDRHARLGGVTELRILRHEPGSEPRGGVAPAAGNSKGRTRVWSGYFGPDDLEGLLRLIQARPGCPRAHLPPGAHPRNGEALFNFSLQAVNPACLHRPTGRLEEASRATSDRDILAYTLFAVDVDAVRPAGQSATDAEKAAALDVAVAVGCWLEDHGASPIFADSGNGYHLLVPLRPSVGEEVTTAARAAQRLLRHLDGLFSTSSAKVDLATYNPSRLLKLYGTLACKGAHSPARPHRASSIDLSKVPVDVDLLQLVSRWVPLETISHASHHENIWSFSDARNGVSTCYPLSQQKSMRSNHPSSRADINWSIWRQEALERLPLSSVYGPWLTGKKRGNGWLECRDPHAPSGDRHPSAGVADGSTEAERGSFHSFRTGETQTVFDFLISTGQARDFRHAMARVSELSGHPLPAAMRAVSSDRRAMAGDNAPTNAGPGFLRSRLSSTRGPAPVEAARLAEAKSPANATETPPALFSLRQVEAFIQRYHGLDDDTAQLQALRAFLSGLAVQPTLERGLALTVLSRGLSIPLPVLRRTLDEAVRRRRHASAPVESWTDRPAIRYVVNRDTVGGFFDCVLAMLQPLDRFFRGDKGLIFVRPGSGPELVDEASLPGHFTTFAEVSMLKQTENGLEFLGYDTLPQNLARAFIRDDRVRRGLPPLAVYCRAPLFASDWTFIGEPGYFPCDGGVFYDGPAISPTLDGQRHLEHLLDGFCWRAPADRVNFIGILLTSLTMPHWGRGHAFAVINGNKPGVGKTTLARVLGVIVDGEDPAMVNLVADELELEKQLATRVEAGDRIIVVDNAKVKRSVESPVLERCITSGKLNFRRLGTNTPISRPQNDVILCLTMNTTQLGEDLRRRALPINLYLEADVQTTEYTLHDVISYALKHRAELLGELAGLVVAWVEAGRSLEGTSARHSTGQRWARTMDAILQGSGLPGFLSNYQASMHAYDPEYERLTEICLLHANQSARTAGEWAELLRDGPLEARFRDRHGNLKGAHAQAVIVSRLFQAYLKAEVEVEGRFYRLERELPFGATHSPTFRFVPVTGPSEAEPETPP